MQQYFVDINVKVGQIITFNDEQSHHIMRVMRMKKDDVVRVSDAKHQLFLVRVDMDMKHAYGCVKEPIEDRTRAHVEITLVQGLIKGEKWDYVIQKACELGVTKIVPFVSNRSVVKIQNEKIDKKLQRWNKIALEACEQCKRSMPVEVTNPIHLSDVKQVLSELNLIAYEDADHISDKLYHILKMHPTCKSITCVIGSEGGFAKEEVDQFIEQGFHAVSLGTRILRAETAAISMINNIEFYYDMIGD